MNKISKYNYQKRIKELEEESSRLRVYERVGKNIYDALVEMIIEDKKISQGWILKQFREVFK